MFDVKRGHFKVSPEMAVLKVNWMWISSKDFLVWKLKGGVSQKLLGLGYFQIIIGFLNHLFCALKQTKALQSDPYFIIRQHDW